MFLPGSRYQNVGTHSATLPDGTIVTVTNLPLPSSRVVIGWHQRSDGERLDILAYRYLGDATAAWEICDTNDAMDPDALATHPLIAIPGTGR